MHCNINIDPELLAEVTKTAEKLHVSRSAYVCMAIAQKLQAEKVLESFPSIADSLKTMKSENNP